MYKYQLYAILAFLSTIDSHLTDNSVNQWTAWLASIIFAVLAVFSWGKKD